MGTHGKLQKVKVNSKAVGQLLKSSAVVNNLTSRGNAIESALPTGSGEEWEVKSFIGRDRAQVIVKTANHQARETAATTSALQSALGAGR